MIKKAIIPVAGLASRFLPASKVIPKTMFPVVDRPIIQVLVEEAVSAGIKEIAIVISKGQEIVKHHFADGENLKKILKKRDKNDALHALEQLSHLAKIRFFMQKQPKGDGHALLSTGNFLNKGEACLVLFGDELITTNEGKNAAEHLVAHYNKVKSPVIGVQKVAPELVEQYGIVETDRNGNVVSLVEKPRKEVAPSNLAITGKYIINREVLDCIKKSKSSTRDGELRLIDGLRTYIKGKKIHALTLDGERFDTGNKLGLIKANIYFGLRDKIIGKALRQYIKESR